MADSNCEVCGKVRVSRGTITAFLFREALCECKGQSSGSDIKAVDVASEAAKDQEAGETEKEQNPGRKD